MVHREIRWLCGGSDLLWLAGPLDWWNAAISNRKLEQGVQSHLAVPPLLSYDLSTYSLKDQILSLTLNVSTAAVTIFLCYGVLRCKSLETVRSSQLLSYRDNKTTSFWPLSPHGGFFFFWEAGNHAVFMTVAVDSASLNINTFAVLDWCDECRRTGMWRRILLHVFAHSLYAWGKVTPARKPCCFNANVIPAPRFLHRHGTILWAPSRKWRS